MSYYIFKPAVNTSETGSAYPQIQKMVDGYNYKAPNSVHALSREVEKLPTYEPNLDYFVVHNRAKLSDILSVAPISGGFIISEKLKNILVNFNLPKHKFYPAKLQYKEKYYNYYWMHIICNLTENVDYQKSIFFVYYNFSKNMGYIDISSKNELIQKEQNLKMQNPGKLVVIWAEKISLNQSFDRTLDLFKIGTFDSNYYVSQSLQQVILKEKVSGCSLILATNLIIG
jgi:hypothetical protein